jgi:uncharacterized protein YbjT (DUF2867 family)
VAPLTLLTAGVGAAFTPGAGRAEFMTVLVLGATGFVGRALTPALVATGERVRVASRRAAQSATAGVECVQCDVRAPETLGPALAGIDCVYYLVHSMGDHGRDFRDVERRSAETIARVAAESGVRRLVYLGGVEPIGPPSEHLASRLEVGAILRAGPVPTVELRAAMIIGNGSASWQILRDLALRLPFMVLPRWLKSRSCAIALPDVVTALLDARTVPLRESAWFDIPGPEALSAQEMLMIVAELEGRHIPAVRVPLLTPRLSAHWLRLISRADYGVARELVLGLRNDLLPRDRRYWELTGHPPAWSFRQAARDALESEPLQPGVAGWLGRKEERAIRRVFREPSRTDRA